MDNHEDILDALTAFGKNPNPQEIPSVLEQYLNSVAKNGETLFPWTQLKPLILRKMELVIMELRRNLASENIPTRPNVENVRFDVIHARIIDSLHKFNGAPFTIQRLCELLIDPKRHYKRSDKFMRGLEKNVLVVSTVDPFGRKVVSELGNKPVLNGILDINGSYPSRDTTLSVPLPPVPGWVNTTAANRNTGTGVISSAVDSANKAGRNLDTLDKDSDGMVSNSLAVSGTQVFSDQGDPLAVHSEEVVEETVVTMETGEVSSVITDGGEALADRDMEGGDMDREDDRDASSFSSSSSSSSEELSTSSDSIENSLRCSVSPLDMATGSRITEDVTAVDENRPWAAFAQDMKQHQDDLGNTSLSPSSTHPVAGDTSGVSSSSPQHHILSSADPSSLSSSSLLSTETQSSVLPTSPTTSTSTSKSEGNSQEESPYDAPCAPTSQEMTTTSNLSDWQQQSVCGETSSSNVDNTNQSFGVDQTTATSPSASSQHIADMTTTTSTDKLISSSTSTVIIPTTFTTTFTTTSTTNNSQNTSSSSDIHTSSPLTAAVVGGDGASVSHLPTYAQVVASSTTDKTSSSSLSVSSIQHISPYGHSTETVPACDSVAGLERLVGSMEQSLSSTSSSSSSSSSSPICPSSTLSSSTPSSSHPSTTTSHNNSSAVTTSSLTECSPAPIDSSVQQTPAPSSSECLQSEEGEPASKRPRLSMDEENMEDDCISTSGDSCMEQEGDKGREDRLEKHEEEEGGCSSVDSSCVTERKQSQQRESSDQDDVPMEEDEEGGVTAGSNSGTVVSGEVDKENGCSIESTSGDDNNVVDDGVCKADGSQTDVISGNPCTETSDVSTTEGEANQITQGADGGD